jgi:hypothetical protein
VLCYHGRHIDRAGTKNAHVKQDFFFKNGLHDISQRERGSGFKPTRKPALESRCITMHAACMMESSEEHNGMTSCQGMGFKRVSALQMSGCSNFELVALMERGHLVTHQGRLVGRRHFVT